MLADITGAACRLAWAALLYDERREVDKRIHRLGAKRACRWREMSPAATDDLGDVRVDAINIVGVSAGRLKSPHHVVHHETSLDGIGHMNAASPSGPVESLHHLGYARIVAVKLM